MAAKHKCTWADSQVFGLLHRLWLVNSKQVLNSELID